MLSTGMRAPMGLKVYGPDLNAIEEAGMHLEKALKDVPSVKASSVFYDRAVGAPYLEIKLNREAMARYGMTVSDVQEILQVAVGGMTLSTSVEGRERFPLRVRYARELRDNPEDLKRILVPAMNGVQIPLGEIADIDYTRGAQMIRSENTFLVGYVIFDKTEGKAEVDVVEEAAKILKDKTESGANYSCLPELSYKFAGNYEHQLRAIKKACNCYTSQSDYDFSVAVFPVPHNNCIIYSLFRCFCCFFRWFYYALVIWTGLVYEFFSCRIKPSRYVPDAYRLT